MRVLPSASMLGLFLLSRRAAQKTLVLAGSYLVGITGTYWLIQRLWICFA